MASETEQTPGRLQLAAACQFVAKLWLHEVDGDTLQFFRRREVVETWQQLGGTISGQNEVVRESLDLLAEDYCQLLIGPKGHLPPVQSVWGDQVFQSEFAASTQRFYQLYPDYEPPGSIDDHLGSQIHFAGFLISRADDVTIATEVLQRFCAKHLSWPEPLLQRVVQKAKTDFYRGMAEVTRKLIADVTI